MSFNSFTFLVFLALVFPAYWILHRPGSSRSVGWQNLLLLAASYCFYGWWDWRFLSLIVISSVTDYLVGLGMERFRDATRRRLLLALSLCVNLGILATFKYLDFFLGSLEAALAPLGLDVPSGLGLVLPVGISFYTFQTLSYSIDVYRERCPVQRNLVAFCTFVAFFPQLVAGPIERAHHLLPQFDRPRMFDAEQVASGGRQILWGLAKKIIVADGLAGYVNRAYDAPLAASGTELLLASYFFAFQIYCDFSGYSDIAIGTAKLFGIDLRQNFRLPYFSRSLREFWSRWHISLSTWFRDYVYIPLGGNQRAVKIVVANTLVTFALSGLWHGAAWTFVVWGLLHGIYLVPSVLTGKRARQDRVSLRDLPAILITFHLVLLAWVFFRAGSLDDAVTVLLRAATDSELGAVLRQALQLKLLVLILLTVEWIHRDQEHPLDLPGSSVWLRGAAVNATALAILLAGSFDFQPFIYFQF